MERVSLETEPIILLSRRLEALADKHVYRPMGLSETSIKMLGLLKNKGLLTPSDFMETIGATKSNISQRLSFLEKRNYVSKVYARDHNDKRKVFVKLTSAGKKKVVGLEARVKLAKTVFENKFSKKEISDYEAFIKKLNTILDDEGGVLGKIFKY